MIIGQLLIILIVLFAGYVLGFKAGVEQGIELKQTQDEKL